MAARAQAKGGVSGILVSLIVFVALWLTSTVLLVLLYTDQKDLELKNSDLRASVDKTGAELRAAEQARNALAAAATGEAGDAPEAVKSKLRQLDEQMGQEGILPKGVTVGDVSYLQALNLLYETLKSRNKLLTASQDSAQGLTRQIEALTAANTAQQAAFDQQIADLGQKLSELKASWEEYAKSRDREVDGFNQKLTDSDARASRDIQEQRTENKRLATKFDELQNRYGELKERLGTLQIRPQELITARQADGHVVTAKPGEEVVYLDLGRDAGLVLGLQFAVYSAASGIPADGQAKARVEVVNIFDTSAECRIVEVHGRDPILEGDLVANPVFDRERALRFMVVGRFDIDGDGQVDPEGASQIESLIQNWHGTVTQELSAQVDFLVVGAAPPKPVIIGDQTPEAQARFDAAKKVYDAYNETAQTAQALSIPMLTHGVFLHFLGYSGGPRSASPLLTSTNDLTGR
jgi:hypothetical protein